MILDDKTVAQLQFTIDHMEDIKDVKDMCNHLLNLLIELEKKVDNNYWILKGQSSKLTR